MIGKPRGIDWYYPEMDDETFVGVLSGNRWKDSEITLHKKHFGDRIKHLKLILRQAGNEFWWEKVLTK